MNLPNKLAILRMVLIVPFVWLMGLAFNSEGEFLEIIFRILSAIIFVGAAITDYYDGQIARKYNLITNLGKLLDPLADKLLVISALVLLTKYEKLNLWIVLIIILRELLITGLRAIVAAEGVVVAADKLAKWKTATQMIALTIIILVPLEEYVNNILMLIPLILTIQSGIDYVLKSKEVFQK